MNEERASREGPPRRSGGAGGGRRRAAAPLDPADLATALQRSVAEIGTAGPPRAGLARIRRKAKARQRRRTVMAGSAGVLFMAMAVSVVTGNSFDIVPVLTSVVGLGGGDSTPSSGVTATPDGHGQVRTVRPMAGRKGPAIGPGDVTATPSALAGTKVAACTAADLITVDSVDSVIGGVSYGHVEAVAQHPCAVAGPPVLQVANATANAASSVVLLRHNASDGSQLPQVPTWGTVLVLQAGQGYDFQFAWAPDACPAPGTSGAPAGSGTGGGPSGASGEPGGTSPGSASPASGKYQLSYLVTATSLTSPVTLEAACGATVYVTDVYARGAYPLPKPETTPTPQPATTSAAAPDSPSTPPSTSSSAPPPPPPPPSSDVPTNGSGVSPGAPAASPVVSTPSNDGATGGSAEQS
ncbi:hypothetical protein [Actinospica robiniae]|uniref:hypothetical protein n=1 Tax=Actinospica robiniae TaxID=304901 RepID=UPI0004050F07|nr:hypothetical protein [Actinospica robiniae]